MSFQFDDELYRDIILDHYKHPRNKGDLDPADVRVNANNPLCGDEVTITARLSPDGSVQELHFSGRGCSISQASASMMTEEVVGKSVPEALKVINRFKDMMLADGGPDGLGDLEALQGVKQYPVRIKCAVLPWNSLLQGLTERAAEQTGPEAHSHSIPPHESGFVGAPE
ncbi:MAG TPA: SUF system NifU family Fe-S cluster assembly protein [Candidatus Dormibacteraeota bacterium]|jgi:nitrogen fixation NifU-like protein|nr:SUF system NifU family Fe-S cluster assembly protein [Candidatus Dormibacteraeota bacterium]